MIIQQCWILWFMAQVCCFADIERLSSAFPLSSIFSQPFWFSQAVASFITCTYCNHSDDGSCNCWNISVFKLKSVVIFVKLLMLFIVINSSTFSSLFSFYYSEGSLYVFCDMSVGSLALLEAWTRIYFFRGTWIYIFSSPGKWFSTFSWSEKNAFTYAWFVKQRKINDKLEE